MRYRRLAYNSQCSTGTVGGYECPPAPTFQGSTYSKALGGALATFSRNDPDEPLHLIGYSGGGSVVANAALMLLNQNIKVASITLFGAPVDPQLRKELESRGVKFNVFNNPGDTTGTATYLGVLSIGAALGLSTARGAHGTYFREHLNESITLTITAGVE
jgi:pimeloyl-ACP methyl ester carboxylesterase